MATKTEMTTKARAAAEGHFLTHGAIGLLGNPETTPEVARDHIGAVASAYTANVKIRSEIFYATFKETFTRLWMERYNARPEVKARRAEEVLRRHIKIRLESMATEVAGFQKRLAEHPADAFRWADNAMLAAARGHVAGVMLLVLDAEGVDKAYAYAQDMALRGARFPHHSTSAASNTMEQNATAAWAEFCAEDRRG